MRNHEDVIQLLRAAALAAIVACSSDSLTSPSVRATPTGPSNEVSDGAHSGAGLANPHFFYLPPAVPQPSFAGTFDAHQSPEVAICQYDATTGCVGEPIADYTMTSGSGSEVIRVDATAEVYIVNWHTDQFALDLTKTYRIRTLVAGTELGHADVVLGASKTSLKNVDTQQEIALIDGKTLPIKFRIENGAIAAIGANGGSLVLPGGALSLTIPSGALSSTLGVTALPTTSYPADPEIASTVYELGPAGTTFATPATLTIAYDPAKLPSDVAPGAVGLYTVALDGDGTERWSYVAAATVDVEHHTVSAPISHFSRWAVLANASSVSVTPASASVYVPETDYGQAHNTVQVTATVTGSGGKPLPNRAVQWTSADPALATVNASGLVTGVAAGAVNITATSSSATATSAVSVLRPVVRITRADGGNSLKLSLVRTNDNTPSSAGLSVLLYAKGSGADSFTPLNGTGRTVSYSSQNPDVATVDANGTVTGVVPGKATVVASCDGTTAAFSVTVEGSVAKVVLQDPFSGSTTVLRDYGFADRNMVELTVTDGAENVLTDRDVAWDFDLNFIEYVAAAPTEGVGRYAVVPKANGRTTLTARVGGQAGSISVDLIVLYTTLQYLNVQPHPDCHDAGPFGWTYDACAASHQRWSPFLASEIIGTVPNAPFQPLFTFSIRGYSSPGIRDVGCCGGGQTLGYAQPTGPNPISEFELGLLGAFGPDYYNDWNTLVGVVTTPDFTSSEDADGVAVSWQLRVHHHWSLCGLFGADHCYSEQGDDQNGGSRFSFYDWSGNVHSVTIVAFNGRYYFRVF